MHLLTQLLLTVIVNVGFYTHVFVKSLVIKLLNKLKFEIEKVG